MKKAILLATVAGLAMLPGEAKADPNTQCVTSALAGGTADAITVPRLPCGTATNVLILTVSKTNTTTTPTLQMPGSLALPIKTSLGGNLSAGDLKAGSTVYLTGTGTSWLLMSNTQGPIGPTGPTGPQGPIGPGGNMTGVGGATVDDLVTSYATEGTLAHVKDSGIPIANIALQIPVICDGVTDNWAAINAGAQSGRVTYLKAIGTGGCMLSPTTIYPASGTGLYIPMMLSPLSQPASPTEQFFIGVSNVTINCLGTGGFYGVSPSYNNWAGIKIHGPENPGLGVNPYLQNVHADRCTFLNMAQTLDESFANAILEVRAVENSSTNYNVFANSGYYPRNPDGTDHIPSWTPAGHPRGAGVSMLDSATTRNWEAIGNKMYNVGGVGLQFGDAMQPTIRDNVIDTVTMFPIKGGFGNGPAAGWQVATSGTTTTSVILPNAKWLKAALPVGKEFKVSEPDHVTVYKAHVASVVDAGAYFTVYADVTWAHPPANGSYIFTAPTEVLLDGNSTSNSGDNCFDVNQWDRVILTGNRGYNCGALKLGGAFEPEMAGSHYWFGADNVGSYTAFSSDSITATGNNSDGACRNAITVNGIPSQVTITGNTFTNHNACGQAAIASIYVAGGGVATGTHTTVSANNISSPAGLGIQVSSSTYDKISGNNIFAPLGILTTNEAYTDVSDNWVVATGTGAGTFALGNSYVAGAAGGNSSNVKFKGNDVRMTAPSYPGTSYGIWNSDSSALTISADAANSLSAAASSNYVPQSGLTVTYIAQTCTLTWIGSGGGSVAGGTGTYCHYTDDGTFLDVDFHLAPPTSFTGLSGNLMIGQVTQPAPGYYPDCRVTSMSGITITGYTFVAGFIAPGDTRIQFNKIGSNVAATNVTIADAGATADIYGYCRYRK